MELEFWGGFVCFVFWQKDEQEFCFTYPERMTREETFVWWLIWGPDKERDWEQKVRQLFSQRIWETLGSGTGREASLVPHHRGDGQHPQALLGLRVGPNRRGGGIWQKEILCKDTGLLKKSWEGWRPDSEKSGSQRNLDMADTKSCQNLLAGAGCCRSDQHRTSTAWPPASAGNNQLTVLPPKMRSPGRSIRLVKPRSQAVFVLPEVGR